MDDLYLIARIADERIAMPARSIGSVVEIDQIAPVPRVAPHIAGLFALRSRVLTVVDTRTALDLGSIARTADMKAVIVNYDGHSYALLVDEVEDVVDGRTREACPAVLAGRWAEAAIGSIRHGEEAILLIDPAVLIAGAEPLAA